MTKEEKEKARQREAEVAGMAEAMFVMSQYAAIGSMSIEMAFKRAEDFVAYREQRWEALK